MAHMNATARIKWAGTIPTTALEQVPTETTIHQQVRVSLRPMSRPMESTVLGALTVGAYMLHLPYTRPYQFKAGQRFEAILDDEDDWHDYTVRQVKRQGGLWDIVAERV